MKIEKITQILKLSPLIIGVLTVIGYIKIQIFFMFFEVKISNYLKLADIVLLFFNEIIILVLAFILTFIYLDNNLSKKKKDDKEISESKPKSKIKRYLTFNNIVLFIGIVLLLVRTVGSIYLGRYYNLVHDYSIVAALLILYYSTSFFLSFVKKYVSNKSQFVLFFTIIFIILFGGLTIYIPRIAKAYEIRFSNGQSKEVSFEINDEIYSTNDHIIYLDQTIDYLFLFDNLNNETLIFKNSEIKNFKIKL